MATAKPTVKFKTYRQSARVGGKIYGVANLADPQIASVTMQEVIDYAKLHNYSASTLEALLSQVIAGVADLVARDGRSRNLSDLLKFEPVIKGTFDNMEQGISNAQKIVIRPRLLKEIRVNIASDAFAWQNENDTLSPRIISVAPDSEIYTEITRQAAMYGFAAATGFGWTLAGTRLAPNGWDASCKFEVVCKAKTPDDRWKDGELHFELSPDIYGYGYVEHRADDVATDNAIDLGFYTTWIPPGGSMSDSKGAQCWFYDASDPTSIEPYDGEYPFVAGDQLVFRFTRTTGSGDTFTVEKPYTLA